MSVPMTLKNNGWNILFDDIRWFGKYEIGNTKVFDAATDFKENMNNDYSDDAIVCVSFQQKKRLSLGRGGVILFNDSSYEKMLKRLRHDGRDHYVSDRDEMRDNPNVTLPQLMIEIGLGRTAIQNNVTYLRKNGLIERVGSNKTGYWKVKVEQ